MAYSIKCPNLRITCSVIQILDSPTELKIACSAFALTNVLGIECVPLRQAYGRVLAEDAIATRDQPPFRSSAMDGYALRAEEVVPGAVFDVIGASAAGKGFRGNVGPGQAVRIFTGAPVPQGADRVVIQEDVSFAKDQITLGAQPTLNAVLLDEFK